MSSANRGVSRLITLAVQDKTDGPTSEHHVLIVETSERISGPVAFPACDAVGEVEPFPARFEREGLGDIPARIHPDISCRCPFPLMDVVGMDRSRVWYFRYRRRAGDCRGIRLA